MKLVQFNRLSTRYQLFILIFITTLLSTFQLSAQAIVRESNEYRTGSVYSYRALGSPIDLRSANTAGMGLSGVAIYNGVAANYANPAIWSRTVFSLGNGTMRVQTIDAKDQNSTATNGLLDAINFQLVLPIKKNKLGVSASLSSISRKNYAYFNDGVISGESIGSTTDLFYLNDNKGEGGLSKVELGVGYSVSKNVSIGYAPAIIMGFFENSVATSFSNPIYRPLTYEFTERQFGLAHRFGVYAFKNGVFQTSDLVSFGLNLELPVNLTSKDKVTATYTVLQGTTGNERTLQRETDLAVDGRSGEGTMRLPLKVETGVLYQKTPALAFSAEWLYQPMSNFEDRLGNIDPLLTDRNRFAGGVQWLPTLNPRNKKFFKSLQYRAGLSYDTGYLTINSTAITTKSVHFGLSIPAKNSRSSVDLAFEYGLRGTTANNLVEERFWNIKMSFNLAELMFFDRRFQ
jgi:hypothetical protein